MIITVASFKGGVAKTVTAVHLAAYLQSLGETVLIDGDPNRSATGWSKRGELPFKTVDERQAAKHISTSKFDHIVIDTQARPNREDLEALVAGCDLLVIPCIPDALSLDALMLTINELKAIGSDRDRYKILLTITPPKPSKDAAEARATLIEAGLPLFKTSIPRLSAFQKAALNGVLVYQCRDSRAGIAWASYKSVGKEIIK